MPVLDGLALRPVNSLQVPASLDEAVPQTLPRPHISQVALNNFKDANNAGLLVKPRNQYKNALKNFASAEGVALGINAAATWALTHFTNSPGLLTAIGPVVEKVGFFVWEGIKEFRKPSSEDPFAKRLINMFKGTLDTLKTDLLFHDTTYMALMRGVLALTQGIGLPLSPTVVPIAAAACFALAVPIAPWLELKTWAGAFELAKFYLTQKKGFRADTYHEIRFVLSDASDPREIMEALSKRFGLHQHHVRKFTDTYFTNTFPESSGREVVARERKIAPANQPENIIHHNFEIVVSEVQNKKSKIGHNILPTRKQKFATTLKDGGSARERDLGAFWNKRLKREESPTLTLEFLSYCARNDHMRVDLDIFPTEDGKAIYLLEIKVYPESQDVLGGIMDYLREKFDITQTTRSPHDVVPILQKSTEKKEHQND